MALSPNSNLVSDVNNHKADTQKQKHKNLQAEDVKYIG